MEQQNGKHASAWLSMPGGDELPQEVAETIRPISEKIGFVPNVARLLAVTPSHFVWLVALLRRVDAGPLRSHQDPARDDRRRRLGRG